MMKFDASEQLAPFRDDSGYGAILFDGDHVRQPEPAWFLPEHWGEVAVPVTSGGGRGGAWFLQTPGGDAVLRHYLRGGLAARLSRDKHVWRDDRHIRSFIEYRLLRELHARKLPVPRPFAAWYRREGMFYRAAIMMQRLQGVLSLAQWADQDRDAAPWEAAGVLIARFHRAGLDHADLNAHNLLFDMEGKGWMIDFDLCRIRIPETAWREGNLSRLHRSLLKLRGTRTPAMVDADFMRLRAAYDAHWAKGN